MPAQDCREGLEGDPDHVVQGLLGREGGATGLGMEPEPAGRIGEPSYRSRISRAQSRRAALNFADLFQDIVVGCEEEGEPGAEFLEGEPCRQGPLDVFQAVGEGESQLLWGRGSGLPHVVSRDGDGIPAWNLSLHRRP